MRHPPVADVAIVGSGFCGLLAARELVRAGREVVVIERGGRKSHAQQLADGQVEVDAPCAAHNHERAPGSPNYPWNYAYGVGGSSLHWTGVAPRLLPSDFEVASRFGVGRDWPLSYEDLMPFYVEAERLLEVAGGPNPLFPGTDAFPQAAHPDAPVDRLLRPLLDPYFSLPQARTTHAVHGRGTCSGVAQCDLCPLDARYSGLHTIEDDGLERMDGFTLRERTAVARLRATGSRVTALECVGADGTWSTLSARTVVLAANGIENPAILLRSGLDGPDVGRWLYDHSHGLVEIELDRPSGSGHGTSLSTGVSYAYADGEFRATRASLLAYPFNPGPLAVHDLAHDLARGHTGQTLRERTRRRFEHTVALDVIGEDLPAPDRYMELAPRRDQLGLPLNRIHYGGESDYLRRSRELLHQDVERRLRPLGARIVRSVRVGEGSHLLGTCYMGHSSGVVDSHQRHHRFDNLYVAGSSSFPSYSAHHPTLTIAALAIRLGRHIASAGT
jgi:choline dehydrogenase-like flavoprotein